MRWEELEDELEVLETEREYDGYFCSIKDAVIIVIFGKPVRFAKRKENPRVGNDRIYQNILSRNLRNQTDTVLLAAVKSTCNNTAGTQMYWSTSYTI